MVKLFLFCSFIAISVSGQNKLSQQLLGKKFTNELSLLSISVKDTVIFQKKYKGTVHIVHRQTSSKCFLITGFNETAFEQLKADPNILFIDHHSKPVVEAGIDYAYPSFNRITKAKHSFTDVKGSNRKVSIKEESFDAAEINLIGRTFTTSVSPSVISQHASTMAILIAGAGNSSAQAEGVAPNALCTSSDFNNLFPDASSIFTTNNIQLQNHSYGVGIENYYGNEAYTYDQQVSQYPTLAHVFSVGNLGNSKPTSGTYQNLNFANLSGNFKQAKNVLLVNAVDTTLTINKLNSRGPAFDGRLKPELTAFGQGGTSESAALVSGISLLVQEKFQNTRQTLPDVSMVKAILIASADDYGAKGIDYLYGYGITNAFKALQLIDQNQIVTSTLSNNNEVSIPITIPTSTSEIKIAVAWTDPPAVINSSKALVNDIDSWFEVGGNTIYPWVLSSYPKEDSLAAAPKRKADHLNNVEFITLSNPPAGTYQLRLKSGNLQNGSQKISVAYSIRDQKKFEWDFPVANEIVAGGKKNLLTWDALPDQNADLSFQIHQGTWTQIATNLDLDNYSFWTAPNVFAKAKLKMTINAEDFISEEFLISPEIKMQTAFNCTDSLGLSWNKVRNASQYQIYTLGDQYLRPVTISTDTVLVLPKSTEKYFAVAPVLNGLPGLKSETINYSRMGAFCFLNLFSATRFDPFQIKVEFNISSWHAVDHVDIIKSSNGSKSLFQQLVPGSSNQFSLYDNDLIPGLMTYQAEIVFRNGTKITSEVYQVPIEEKGKAIVYPNPLTEESDLNILSEGPGYKILILNLLGQVLIEKELGLVVDSIDLINLIPGIYIYQLLQDGKLKDSGRIVKY